MVALVLGTWRGCLPPPASLAPAAAGTAPIPSHLHTPLPLYHITNSPPCVSPLLQRAEVAGTFNRACSASQVAVPQDFDASQLLQQPGRTAYRL